MARTLTSGKGCFLEGAKPRIRVRARTAQRIEGRERQINFVINQVNGHQRKTERAVQDAHAEHKSEKVTSMPPRSRMLKH